jgi:hypothetical protein
METEMNNKKAFTSYREALLATTELNNENCIRYCLKLMLARKEGIINSTQMEVCMYIYSREKKEQKFDDTVFFTV